MEMGSVDKITETKEKVNLYFECDLWYNSMELCWEI